jgi:hypothetical protein
MPRSRPSRARGLKLNLPADEYEAAIVAPFAGAWIETNSTGCAQSEHCLIPDVKNKPFC